MAKKKAKPTKKAKPKTINVGSEVNISAEVIALFEVGSNDHNENSTIGNFGGDMRRWLVELDRLIEKYGDGVKLKQLRSPWLDAERARLNGDDE